MMGKIHWPMMAIAVLFVAAVAALESSVIKTGTGSRTPQSNRMWIKE
jgi:hypothetical protein